MEIRGSLLFSSSILWVRLVREMLETSPLCRETNLVSIEKKEPRERDERKKSLL